MSESTQAQQSTLHGISSEVAAERLEKYSPNTLEEKRNQPC